MGARLRAGIPAGDRAVDGLDELRRHEIASAHAVRHARRGSGLRYAPRHPVPRRRAAEDGDQAQGLFGQLQIRPHRPLDALAAAVIAPAEAGVLTFGAFCAAGFRLTPEPRSKTWIAGMNQQRRYFFNYSDYIPARAPVAQGIEHLPSKQRVEGSNPSGTAKSSSRWRVSLATVRNQRRLPLDGQPERSEATGRATRDCT